MATGLALGKLLQVGDLPMCLLDIASSRQGQTNPVMHPDRQVLRVRQQTLSLLRQVLPGGHTPAAGGTSRRQSSSMRSNNGSAGDV